MGKLSITRFTAASKLIATKAGTELQELVRYVATIGDDLVSNLKNGLTFSENFNAKFVTLSLTHDTVSGVNVGEKRAKWVTPVQVISSQYGLDAWSWYVASDGSTKVKASFTGSPSGPLDVVVLIVYG